MVEYHGLPKFSVIQSRAPVAHWSCCGLGSVPAQTLEPSKIGAVIVYFGSICRTAQSLAPVARSSP